MAFTAPKLRNGAKNEQQEQTSVQNKAEQPLDFTPPERVAKKPEPALSFEEKPKKPVEEKPISFDEKPKKKQIDLVAIEEIIGKLDAGNITAMVQGYENVVRKYVTDCTESAKTFSTSFSATHIQSIEEGESQLQKLELLYKTLNDDSSLRYENVGIEKETIVPYYKLLQSVKDSKKSVEGLSFDAHPNITILKSKVNSYADIYDRLVKLDTTVTDTSVRYSQSITQTYNRFNNMLQRAMLALRGKQELEDLHQATVSRARETQMSQHREQALTAQLDILATRSGYGGLQSLENLSKIILVCIKEEYGTLDRITSFGVDGNRCLVINGEKFTINNRVPTDSNALSMFCPKDAEAIRKGNLASCFSYKDLYSFPNLSVIDLSDADSATILDARRELGIDKGKWGNLLRRKAKLPSLELIKLPEGDVTRENSSFWNKFKSEKAYQEASNEAVRIRNSKAGRQSSDLNIGEKVGTIKDMVWSKPVPRMLVKTFGYGIGVPMYWGAMMALGPFGMLMGALGVGALAHHEIKNFKKNGGL